MSGRRLFARVLVALGAAPIAGCIGASEQPDITRLRVFVQPLLAHAPLLIADAEGYFAEQGIQVEFVRMGDAAQAVPMLINGTLDVLPGGASAGLLNAMTRGLPVRAVADKGYYQVKECSRGGLVLRTGLAEGAKTGRPVVRRISIDRQPQQQYIVERLLASVGFALNDLEVLYIPHLPEMEALANGAIDAALAGDPWLTTIVERGIGVPWVRLEDVLPGLQFSFIFFGPNLLEKHPDAGRRFLIAYLKAVRQLEEGKTPRNLAVLTRVTEEGGDRVQRMCWPAYHVDGRISMEHVMAYQAWALERGLIERIAEADQFQDVSLLEQANAELAADAR